MSTSKLVIGIGAAFALSCAIPVNAQSTAGGSTVTGASGEHSNTTVETTSSTSSSTDSSQRTKNLNLDSFNTDNSQRTKTVTEDSNNTSTDNSQHNRAIDSFNTNNSQRNGNIHLVADQTLNATISNESTLYFNGKKSNYNSGSNTIDGAAFAAYSGILNQGWNTGINSNAQAATNIAAQGTTSFTTH